MNRAYHALRKALIVGAPGNFNNKARSHLYVYNLVTCVQQLLLAFRSVRLVMRLDGPQHNDTSQCPLVKTSETKRCS